MRARPRPAWRDPLPGNFVYIYVMHCMDYYKIGIARGPAQRMKVIQQGNPFAVSLKLRRSVRYESAHLIETAVQRALESFHVRGEWFHCELSRIQKLVADAIRQAERKLPRYDRTPAETLEIAAFLEQARTRTETALAAVDSKCIFRAAGFSEATKSEPNQGVA